MGKASIDVISRYTKPWPKDNPTTYFVEFWKKWFKEDLDVYNSSHQIYSRDREIAVFYDQDGELHVIRCDDRSLEQRIKERMDSWYKWICKKEYASPLAYYCIETLLTPYVTPLKEGFVQVRYRGMVCNLSDKQYRDVCSKGVYKRRLEGSEIYEAETDIPRLNEMLSAMVLNGDIWPLRGPV